MHSLCTFANYWTVLAIPWQSLVHWSCIAACLGFKLIMSMKCNDSSNFFSSNVWKWLHMRKKKVSWIYLSCEVRYQRKSGFAAVKISMISCGVKTAFWPKPRFDQHWYSCQPSHWTQYFIDAVSITYDQILESYDLI